MDLNGTKYAPRPQLKSYALLFIVLNALVRVPVASVVGAHVDFSFGDQQDAAAPSPGRSGGPFLILMSSDEIALAQLPLIDNGNVSVVYKIELAAAAADRSSTVGDQITALDDSEPVESNEEMQTSSNRTADAREYEQMPSIGHRSEPNSLGNSEWRGLQSVAHTEEVPAEKGQRTPVTTAAAAISSASLTRGEGGGPGSAARAPGGSNDEAAVATATPVKRARRTISSDGKSLPIGTSARASTPDDDHGAVSGRLQEGTAAASQQAQEPTIGPTRDSRFSTEGSPVLNVTSAQFGGHNRAGANNELQEMGIAAQPAAEDAIKDEEAGAGSIDGGGSFAGEYVAQFSDFDVHMSLGYVFVADSRGRVHRFGLNLVENKWDKPALEINNDDVNSIGVPALSSMRKETGGEPDDKNDLSKAAAANIELSKFPHKSLDPTTLVINEDNTAVVHSSTEEAVDATHEQFGRHPVSASGGVAANADNEDYDGRMARVQQDNLMGGAAPTFTLRNSQLYGEANHRRHQASAKPRIIWSRNRQSAAPMRPKKRRPSSRPSAQQKQNSSIAQQNEANGRALPDIGVADNQRAGEAQQRQTDGGDGDSIRRAARPTAAATTYENTVGALRNGYGAVRSDNRPESNAGKPALAPTSLRTEIAVDWLNNLLFVLDKYRLVVVDLEGNNELVLIDDFNANNRPVDIKVDPVNDFLFWLQVGTFHNTIYKLDLSVLSVPAATERFIANTLKVNGLNGRANHVKVDVLTQVPLTVASTSESGALISHHYAHAIITNLPQAARLFTLDHKHSRIYVPLPPASTNSAHDINRTQIEDAEVFTPVNAGDLSTVTHLNSTSANRGLNRDVDLEDVNCNTTTDLGPDFSSRNGQILAYNLDGTDVGPLRNGDDKSHLSGLDDIQDISLDAQKGYLYWLTNDGRELFEEYKSDNDSTFYSAQHNLDGKRYLKLVHFAQHGANQPVHLKPRFNLRKIIQLLLSASATNRHPRSDLLDDGRAPRINSRQRLEPDTTHLSQNSPYLILGILGLVALSVYLIYVFVFQQASSRLSSNSRVEAHSSVCDSSVGGSQEDGNDTVASNGFNPTGTITRWLTRKPSGASEGNSSHSYGQNHSSNREEPCEFESAGNFETDNAVDEHYRDLLREQSHLFDFGTERNQLANLSGWPLNMHDMSNKRYIPLEVLQDEELASIKRISIDQLEVDHRRALLGEGHFGTVLQGAIKCTEREKELLMNRASYAASTPVDNQQVGNAESTLMSTGHHLKIQRNHRTPLTASSSSSGHGSSSTSSEIIPPTSCGETSSGDYLTPKSQCNSALSDYYGDNPSSRADSALDYYNSNISQQQACRAKVGSAETRLQVAIKKLKENASAEEKRDFLQEAKLLANFDHRNIVRLVGICLDRGSTLLVLELMLGGDLIRYMQENNPMHDDDHPEKLTYDDLLSICLDIVNGCCYLEELNYIHRDLAARNCLVSSRKREDRIVKLADFGLARDIYKDSYYKKVNDSAMPLKWMAPECLIEQKFTTMSDVWSFGVVMWEVMSYCQEKPYGNVEPFFMKEHLTGGARLRKPDVCCDDMYELMNRCWQLQPNCRPTFQACRSILMEVRGKLYLQS